MRGFAVNLPESASQLTRLDRDALDELLGADRYHYARSQDEIVLGVGEARLGREFYPFLLPLIALILGLEHLLSKPLLPPRRMNNRSSRNRSPSEIFSGERFS